MKSRNQQTVTQGGWSVSSTSGALPHGQVILNVRRHFNVPNEYGGLGKAQPGDHDGKIFPDTEAAHAFALEHGYTQIFVHAWCPQCRCLHRGQPYRVRELLIHPRRGYLASLGCRA